MKPVGLLSVVALSLSFVAPVDLMAQETEPPTLMLTGLLGTGTIDSELGLTGGLGLALGTSRYMVRAMFDVHLVRPESGDYSWDIDPTDPTCRDDRSNLPVDESFCSSDRALTGFSAEASTIVPAFRGGIHIGAGYRMGAGSTPFGIIGYGYNPNGGNVNILLRLVAGRDLLGVQAAAAVPFTRR